VEALLAEFARAVGPRERRNHDVSLLDCVHIPAYRLDDADELVAHALADADRLLAPVPPEVAAADTGARDPDDGVSGLFDAGVGNGLDADVAGAVHDGGSHRRAMR
jgi:hypothetical protein